MFSLPKVLFPAFYFRAAKLHANGTLISRCCTPDCDIIAHRSGAFQFIGANVLSVQGGWVRGKSEKPSTATASTGVILCCGMILSYYYCCSAPRLRALEQVTTVQY